MDDFDKIIRGDGKPVKGGLFHRPKHGKKGVSPKQNLVNAAGDALAIADSLLKLRQIHIDAMKDCQKQMECEASKPTPDVLAIQRIRCDFLEEKKRAEGCLREFKYYMRQHKLFIIRSWIARG